jgi:cobalt/nickel transport system permease protein
MIEELFDIERTAYRDSPVHRLDARVKVIITVAAILTIVAFPYSAGVYIVGGMIFLYCAGLWAISGVPPGIYFMRLLLILPFGIFIILFQIFFENPYYAVFHPVVVLPLGVQIFAESVEFATILGVKSLVCVSFVILLSSTTKMQDLLEGAGRLGMPAEFTLVLGMMIRYLFVFAAMYRRIKNALETRCFDAFDSSLPYRYRLRKLSYTIGTVFIRSFEQGERTYTSMLCRGYGRGSHLFITKKPLRKGEWLLLGGTIAYFAGTAIGGYVLL